MAYYIYVLRCKGDTLYTGITPDLRRRMRQHCGQLAGRRKIHPQPQTGGAAPGVGNCRPYCRRPV